MSARIYVGDDRDETVVPLGGTMELLTAFAEMGRLYPEGEGFVHLFSVPHLLDETLAPQDACRVGVEARRMLDEKAASLGDHTRWVLERLGRLGVSRASIANSELTLIDVPVVTAGDEELGAFAMTFSGYRLWDDVGTCAQVARPVFASWSSGGPLPGSLTLLRTALFFEWRAMHMTDYIEDISMEQTTLMPRAASAVDAARTEETPLREIYRYLRDLVRAIGERVANGSVDTELQAATEWFRKHPYQLRSESDRGSGSAEYPEVGDVAEIDNDLIARAVAAATRGLERDLAAGGQISENVLRAHLCEAFENLLPDGCERERHVEVPGFQGVGPVDIVLGDPAAGTGVGLVECKWSVASRDKIYEGAWDAIKLALAVGDGSHSRGWLITGAESTAWDATETPDLFETATIETTNLWKRPLRKRGPNGGRTVGEDCENGGYGNMFTHAPAKLHVQLVATAQVAGTPWIVKASRIRGGGELARFASDPEFPSRIGDAWLSANLPAMEEDKYQRLLHRLRLKRWTDEELASKVYPHRPR